MTEPNRTKKGSSAAPAGRLIAALLLRLIALSALLAGLLMIPAGRLDWFQAWLFVIAFTAFLIIYGLWAIRHDSGQLAERSRVGANTEAWDRILLAIYTIFLIEMLVLAGLDAGRFRWVPLALVWQAVGWLAGLLAGGVILFMLGIPLMLGSGWAEVIGGLIGVLFVIRTALEDRTLRIELPGYQEYAECVRYRLIPGLW